MADGSLSLYILAVFIGAGVVFLIWVLYQMQLDTHRNEARRAEREQPRIKPELAERKSRKGSSAPSRLEWYSGR